MLTICKCENAGIANHRGIKSFVVNGNHITIDGLDKKESDKCPCFNSIIASHKPAFT